MGGGIALVVLIIAITVAANSGGSGANNGLAVNNGAANAPAAAAPPPAPLVVSPQPPPIASTPRVRVNPAATPSTINSAAGTTSSVESGSAVIDSPDFGQPLDSPDFGKPAYSSSSRPSGQAEHSLVQLPPAVATWHGKGTRLTGLFKGGDAENPVTNISWMAGLLPHLGYQREFERLALHKPSTDAANLAVGHTLVPEFQNPLDSRKTWEGYPFGGMALTHFAGMSGIEDARNVCAAQLPRSDPRAGVFGYDSVARPDEITDGMSQTILVVGSGRLANPWLFGGGATVRGAREPLFDGISGLGTEGLPSAGTLVLMADGSVRTVPRNIDPQVFRGMCTIHGRESVDLESAAPVLPIETFK